MVPNHVRYQTALNPVLLTALVQYNTFLNPVQTEKQGIFHYFVKLNFVFFKFLAVNAKIYCFLKIDFTIPKIKTKPQTPKAEYMVFTKTSKGTNEAAKAAAQRTAAYFPVNFGFTRASTETPEEAAVVSMAQ